MFPDEHTFITASLLEMFGARSSVGVNQQICTESIGVFYGRWRSLFLFPGLNFISCANESTEVSGVVNSSGEGESLDCVKFE